MQPLTLQETIEAYAADAVEAARADFQTDLDYSIESLQRLDEILGILYQVTHHERHSGAEPERLEQMTEMFTKMWGSYLGEVLRRKWGGQWSIPSDGPYEGMAALTIGRLVTSPMARTYKRIMSGEAESVLGYADALEQKLAEVASRPEPDAGAK